MPTTRPVPKSYDQDVFLTEPGLSVALMPARGLDRLSRRTSALTCTSLPSDPSFLFSSSVPLPRTCSYTLGLLGFIAGAWAAGYHPPTLSLHARSPAVLKQLLGRLAGSLGRQAQTWNAPSACLMLRCTTAVLASKPTVPQQTSTIVNHCFQP